MKEEKIMILMLMLILMLNAIAADGSPAIFGPLSAPIWLQVCASICSGLLSVVPSFCKKTTFR